LQPKSPEATLFNFVGLIKKYIGSADTIFELGARDCNETIAFSKELPDAHIYSFECNPATLPQCRKRVKDISHITLVEKAVSNRDGTVSFFPIDQEKTETTWEDGNPGASSMLPATGKYPIEKYVQNKITVPSTTLKSFLESKRIPKIDAIWMDLQGAELMALEGLGDKLQNVGIIHCEVEFLEIYKGQALYKEIKRFMNSNGFWLIGFTSFGAYSADAVFLNVRYLPPIRRYLLLFNNTILYYVLKLRLRLQRSHAA